mmetsp:Transcript_12887/g.30368  ORF Transcript_12887/g.30368 Transcript_12887/m.30368 type:complete len:218 (-) Transcript_12887:438-1091(-)
MRCAARAATAGGRSCWTRPGSTPLPASACCGRRPAWRASAAHRAGSGSSRSPRMPCPTHGRSSRDDSRRCTSCPAPPAAHEAAGPLRRRRRRGHRSALCPAGPGRRGLALAGLAGFGRRRAARGAGRVLGQPALHLRPPGPVVAGLVPLPCDGRGRGAARHGPCRGGRARRPALSAGPGRCDPPRDAGQLRGQPGLDLQPRLMPNSARSAANASLPR